MSSAAKPWVLFIVMCLLWLVPISERLRTRAPLPASTGKILILNWDLSPWRHHYELGQLKSSCYAFNCCPGLSHSLQQGMNACSSLYCILPARAQLTTSNRSSTESRDAVVFSAISNPSPYVRVQSSPTHSHHFPASFKTRVNYISSIVSQY